MSFASDVITASIQYGYRDYICQFLETTKWRVEPVLNLYDYNVNFMNIKASDYSLDFFSDVTIDFNRADRAWNWMICNEFGWF